MRILSLILSLFMFVAAGRHTYIETMLIPKNLIEFKEKYPEASEFVDNYPKKKNKNYDMDVSKEIEAGNIPLFIQWDERWGYKQYGNNCLGVTGCGPTCLSMIVCGMSGTSNWNPYEVACFAEDNGYYVAGVGSSWNLMTEGAQKLGLSASRGTVSADYIRTNLTKNTPMIASMFPGNFTYTGHFIILTDIDQHENIFVNDPNSLINSTRTWKMEEILPQIRALWKYTIK